MKPKTSCCIFNLKFFNNKGNFHYFHVILRIKVLFVFQLNKLVCGLLSADL